MIAIEALLARPESHQFRVLEALTLVSSGQANFPADLAAEVLRVGSEVRVRCIGCGHDMVLDRIKLEKAIRRVHPAIPASPPTTTNQ